MCSFFQFKICIRSTSNFYASLDKPLCTPKDNDECILNSPGWDSPTWNCNHFTTADYIDYCNTWAKDARRCCPVACKNSEPFTKTVCEASPGQGTCIYPNEAQCGNEDKDKLLKEKIQILSMLNVLS